MNDFQGRLSPRQDQATIHRTVYRYGALETGHFGYLALDATGVVRAYDHPNERRFEFDGRELRFLSDAGAVTSKLNWRPDANAFFQSGESRLYLLPVLTLPPRARSRWTQRIIVNTVPKAGTYFIEHILTAIGYGRLEMHLSADALHDNSGQAAAEIHWAPDNRRVRCPARAFAAAMLPGEFAVGHIESSDELRAIEALGVRLIDCVRDLRDVLVSLYRFKKERVASISPTDDLWRSLEGDTAFPAFLIEHANRDIRFMRDVVMAIVNRCEAPLRFEELRRCELPERSHAYLEAIETGLGDAFRLQSPKSLGQTTSTFSGRAIDGAQLWTPAVERYFVNSGLAAVNESLGYRNSDVTSAIESA